MNLEIQYSYWYILIIIVISFSISYFFYYRENGIHRFLRLFLLFSRFIAIFLILYLLLNPIISKNKNIEIKPNISILIDNSRSIYLNEDSAKISNIITDFEKEVHNRLSKKYNTNIYRFTDGLDIDSSIRNITNISKSFEDIQKKSEIYENNIYILFSDGIYNSGANPKYTANQMNSNVYTMYCGDTNIYKDFLINNVNNNEIAYKDNYFNVDINILAKKYEGKNAKISIAENGKVIQSKDLVINDNSYDENFNFAIKANGNGIKKYDVFISKLDGERTYSNNIKTFFVKILDNKNKLLILYQNPNPDISALNNLLHNEDNSVESYQFDDFNKNINDFDLIILHNLPSKENNINKLIVEAKNKNIPLFFIIGIETSIQQINSYDIGIKINSLSGQNKSYISLNQNFDIFKVNEIDNIFEKLKAIDIPFAMEYNLNKNYDILLYQKIGDHKTKNPILAINKNENHKKSFWIGEGIWKLQMSEYMINENHNSIKNILSKTSQYLITKEDKSFFRITSKNTFEKHEPVIINAQLYNKNYEPIDNKEIILELRDDKQNKRKFQFSSINNNYILKINDLQPGYYTYTASSNNDGNNFSKNGAFIIKNIEIEIENQYADYKLMQDIANMTNAKSYYIDNYLELINELDKKQFKNKIYQENSLNKLIDLKTIFWIIIISISLEWFIRKYNNLV